MDSIQPLTMVILYSYVISGFPMGVTSKIRPFEYRNPWWLGDPPGLQKSPSLSPETLSTQGGINGCHHAKIVAGASRPHSHLPRMAWCPSCIFMMRTWHRPEKIGRGRGLVVLLGERLELWWIYVIDILTTSITIWIDGYIHPPNS